MKRILLSGVIALAGCAASSPAGQVVTFTIADLTNAIAIDKANNNLEKLPCDQWVLTNVQLIQAQAAAATPVIGVFSAGSAVDSASTNILTALGPAGQQQFEMACGPWILHLTGTLTGFKLLSQSAPAIVATLGIKP
jgi:hypothetical protein